jgi:hypothetical protein
MAASARSWLGVLILAVLIVVFDYVTQPLVEAPSAFILPVLVAAWYLGRVPAVVLAVVLPVIRVGFELAVWPDAGYTTGIIAVNFGIRLSVLQLAAYAVSRVLAQQKLIRRLENLLSICSFCKKIHNEDGQWEVLETYISQRSDTRFSHGLCDDCLKTHYGEYQR